MTSPISPLEVYAQTWQGYITHIMHTLSCIAYTTREKPSSSASFWPISGVGNRATDTTLQLKIISSVCPPVLLLYPLSSSASWKGRYW